MVEVLQPQAVGQQKNSHDIVLSQKRKKPITGWPAKGCAGSYDDRYYRCV